VIHLAAPALPLHKAGPYVAAAYVVFLLLVIAYVAIIALRTSRTERALDELEKDVAAREQEHEPDPDLEQAGRKPGWSSETGGRALASGRGAGSPAEDLR
jgi:type II secretory pathway component PulM